MPHSRIIILGAYEALLDAHDAVAQLHAQIHDEVYTGQALATAEGLVEAMETAMTDAKDVMNTVTTDIKNFTS